MVRRVAAVVLALSAALAAYGFYEARLFTQTTWSPAGLRRFLIFAAATLAWSAAMFALRPRWYTPAAIGIAAACTVLTVGALPLGAALLVAFAAFVLGRMLVDDDLVAAVAGLAILISAAGIAVHFRVNYWFVYLGALLAPMAARPRVARLCAHRAAALLRPREVRARSAAAALLLALAAEWLVALKPDTGADSLAMHLAAPALVASQHRWSFDIGHFTWAVMPMGGDWCFTIAYLLGGEFAARLLNLLLLCAIAGLIYTASRSALAAALFASTPLVQLNTGLLMVENVWAALLAAGAAALWRFRASGERKWLYAMAVLLGTAVSTKLGSIAFLIALAPLAVREVIRHRSKPRTLRAAAAAAALLVVLAAPPYWTAYAKTGNPVFPFLNTVFKSPHFDSQRPLADPRFTAPLSPATLYDATFHSERYFEGQGGSLGFQYLLFLPVCLVWLFRKPRHEFWTSLWLGGWFSVLTLAATPNLRYVYPALPLFAIAIAAVIREVPGGRYAAAAVLGLQFWFLPVANWQHRDFYVTNAAEREAYVQWAAPARALVAYMNAAHPGAAVLFTEAGSIAGLEAPAYTLGWHTARFRDRIAAARSRAECMRVLREHGIRFIIGPDPKARVRRDRPVQLDALLEAYTTVERRAGSYVVLRLLDSAVAGDPTPPAAPPGAYDDTSGFLAFTGSWSPGYVFPRAREGTVTYSNAAGASCRLRFRGSSITYVYTRAFNRGIARIEIDGVPQPDLDLYSREPAWQGSMTYGGLGAGEHEFKVTVSGRKSAAAKEAHVDVDAFVVAP